MIPTEAVVAAGLMAAISLRSFKFGFVVFRVIVQQDRVHHHENSDAIAGGHSSKKTQIFRYVCQQQTMGIVDVRKLCIALAVGNKNPGNVGFKTPLKDLFTDGVFHEDRTI